jgi:hypothetical protein
LLLRKNRWETSLKVSAAFKEFLQSTEALLVTGKKSDGADTAEAEIPMICFSQAVLKPVSPEVLQYADAIVHEDCHILTHLLMLSLSFSKGSQSHTICEL